MTFNINSFAALWIFFSFGSLCVAAPKLCESEPDAKSQRLDNFPKKREVIAQNALMSVFSAIAYEDSGLGYYQLPEGWQRVRSIPDSSGLFVATFENKQNKQLVIAYRGTEATSVMDWIQNLSPLVKIQSKPALKITEAEIADHKDWGITLTGHSLGGGLALELSHKLNGVTAVAFNPSPRIGLKRSGYGNRRIVFREKHEPLAVLRGNPSARGTWSLTYEVLVDFTSGFFGTRLVTQHSMDSMAMNLLALSSVWSKDAELLRRSICEAQPGGAGDAAR
ncbi:MAG: Mbeg1-like protein [Sterolibacterium sp.]